nr:65-kDa microtubule-associated protein 3 isoform X1 [Tanacetum cinerariifolium]
MLLELERECLESWQLYTPPWVSDLCTLDRIVISLLFTIGDKEDQVFMAEEVKEIIPLHQAFKIDALRS